MALARVKHGGIRSDVNADGKRTYIVTWVVDHAEGEGPLAVEAATPALGTPFSYNGETDTTVALYKKTPMWVEKGVWEVNCEYSAKGSDPRKNPNPTLRPPLRRWATATHDTYPFKDLDGKPFQNSTGYQYDPSPPVRRHYTVLTITRNEAFFAYATTHQYGDKVNSKPFYGYAPGQALMHSIAAEEDLWENGYTYAKVTYEIHFTRESYGWQAEVLDYGPHWVQKNDKGEIIHTWRKLPWDEEQTYAMKMLDGNGGYLPKEKLQKGEVVYNSFRVYDEVDFSPLGL